MRSCGQLSRRGARVRSRIEIAASADVDAIEAAALADERIAEMISGKEIRKIIVVPGKLVNIVL